MKYFSLVDAAQTAPAPPFTAGHGDTGEEGGDPQPRRNTSSSSFSPSLEKAAPKASADAAERDYTDSWRQALLKEMLQSELGFTTVVRESGVPGAGLGLFVEGSAPEGAVVAIYPVSFLLLYLPTIV